jgi:NAD+ kinase
MKIENHFKDSFLADGVLVSTNMGSSAYNLSAGGPLLLNNANCFVITSICTQSGIIPSIVYNADDQVEITAFAKDEKKYVVVVDGRDQIDAANGTKVFVKKSSEVLHIVTTETENKTINHITKSFNGYTKY